MRIPGPAQQLKVQLAGELCAILDGYERDIGAAYVGAHPSELSRLRHGDLSRFSLARIVRYIVQAGYDVEVQLRPRSRLEAYPKARRPTSSVVRYDYYGRATGRP